MGTLTTLAANSPNITSRPDLGNVEEVKIRNVFDAGIVLDNASVVARQDLEAGKPVNTTLALHVFREVGAGARFGLVREHVGESLAAEMIGTMTRADLTRMGAAIVSGWYDPELVETHGYSPVVLDKALVRIGDGSGGKIFAAKTLQALHKAGLTEQVGRERPELLRTAVRKANGGLELTADMRCAEGVIAAVAALRDLTEEEQNMLVGHYRHSTHVRLDVALRTIEVQAGPNGAGYTASEWAERLHWLVRNYGTEVAGGVIDRHVLSIQTAIRGQIGRRNGWPDWWISTSPSRADTVEWDAPLRLLTNMDETGMYSWVCTLYARTNTAPSTAAAVKTMRTNPDTIGLVLCGKADGTDDETLVNAGGHSATALLAQGVPSVTRTSCSRDEAERRILSGVNVSNDALLSWLLSANYTLVPEWLAGKFSANLPTRATVCAWAHTATVTETLKLFDPKANVEEQWKRLVVCNVANITRDIAQRQGWNSAEWSHMTETVLNIYAEKFGNNVAKWAQLDVLEQTGQLNDLTVEQILVRLG